MNNDAKKAQERSSGRVRGGCNSVTALNGASAAGAGWFTSTATAGEGRGGDCESSESGGDKGEFELHDEVERAE